jgi:hypothetical protein
VAETEIANGTVELNKMKEETEVKDEATTEIANGPVKVELNKMKEETET